MLLILGIVIGVALSISFMCSLMEATLLSVSLPYIRYLADAGSKRAKIILGFKERIGVPISAILILNTVSHTVGASIGGSIVSSYGEKAVIAFSIVFTVLVFFLSEILPKKIGSTYNRQVSLLIAIPLQMMVKILSPIIYVTEIFSKRVSQGGEDEPRISHEEVISMAELGKEEGVIDSLEDSVIRNVIGLDTVLVRDVLTPRVVVFSLKEGTLVSSLKESLFSLPHSRIPVFPDDTLDEPSGYVTQRDLSKVMLEGDGTEVIKDLKRSLVSVPDTLRADKLMLQMVDRQVPICAVINEHGGFAGVVTLEDILEEIIGKEIVDEFDEVRDLRNYAKTLHELKKPEFKS
jgi:CBS domain containing-hemolysin-like protein